MGKVPNLTEDEVAHLIDNWDFNKDTGRLTWFEFRDCLNNKWSWRLTDREKLNEMIDQFFKLAYKYRMQGNEKDSKEYAARALRLQGSLTKTKPIEIERKKEETLPKRGDFLTLKVFRRPEGDNLAATTTSKYNEPIADLTATFKLAPGVKK